MTVIVRIINLAIFAFAVPAEDYSALLARFFFKRHVVTPWSDNDGTDKIFRSLGRIIPRKRGIILTNTDPCRSTAPWNRPAVTGLGIAAHDLGLPFCCELAT